MALDALVSATEPPRKKVRRATLFPLFQYNEESTLTAFEDRRVSGMLYVPRFLDTIEQYKLKNRIYKEPWQTDLKRRVQHYGWKYDYRSRCVRETDYLGPLPDWLSKLAKTMSSSDIACTKFDQVIVNEYKPGQGIGDHVDEPEAFADEIVTVSLGHEVPMVFRHTETKEQYVRRLSEGSLLRIKGEARYKWTHGIRPKKEDTGHFGLCVKRKTRVSVTFRRVVKAVRTV